MCVYFIDRCLGKRVVAAALRGTGAQVEVHDDHFAQDCPDDEWLAEVGRRGWIVLTKDNRIRYHNSERVAVAGADVRMFALVGGNLTGEQVAAAFVKALPAMQRRAAEHEPPSIATVRRDGAVKQWQAGGGRRR